MKANENELICHLQEELAKKQDELEQKDIQGFKQQEAIIGQNTIIKNLQLKYEIGNGEIQRNKAKAGMGIRTPIPYDESEYKRLLADGKTQHEIAKIMGMSISTLKRNRRKLGKIRDETFRNQLAEKTEIIIKDLEGGDKSELEK